MRPVLLPALVLSLLATGCPATLPSGSGGLEGAARGGASAAGSARADIDPNRCGDYASSSELGARIKLFLQATVRLQAAVSDLANYVRDTCALMGDELGLTDLDGDTRALCAAVRDELANNLSVSIESQAGLEVSFEPARCEVNAEVDASARGACAGSASSGDGAGSASAECEGYAAVDATLEARCEPPSVDVRAEAGIVVDASKLELALAAIRAGLPRLLEAHARATGPVRIGLEQWARSVRDLKNAQQSYFSALGNQAVCVTGQIARAFGAVADIRAQVEVSVEVSVQVSGSAGASI